MSTKEDDAYNATCRAAGEIVEICSDSIRGQIKAGEITDEESLSDAIHETVDSALIYTRDQYICVWGLRDEEDAIEEGLCSPTNFVEVLAAQAFLNLRNALPDFSDDLQVAADAREEGDL